MKITMCYCQTYGSTGRNELFQQQHQSLSIIFSFTIFVVAGPRFNKHHPGIQN